MSEFQPIGSFSKVRRGASPRPINNPDFFGGDVGWVRISDVTQRNRKYLRQTQQYLSPLGQSRSLRVDAGDLIMSICATVGKPMIVDMPACIHDGFVQIYDIQNADTEYLYYLLQFHEKDFEKRGQPGTQVNLNTTIVENEIVFIPSLLQQQKIAKILSTVDNLIEKTQTLIVKYTSIKQGMMADLFTRGIDMTTGDASNSKGYKLRPSVEDAPELYKQTELGWVPKEWEVLPLGELAEKIQDGTHFSPVVGGGEYLYLTSKNIRFGYLTLKNIETISKSQHDAIFKRCNVRKGDLLLTKDGANTGNAAINNILEPFSMLSSVAFIRSNELSNEEYLLHYILSDVAQNRIKDAMSGNAITRLTLEKINNFNVPVPTIEEQLLVAERLRSLKDLVDGEQRYLEKLMENKKGLMQDLLTGKVKVV